MPGSGEKTRSSRDIWVKPDGDMDTTNSDFDNLNFLDVRDSPGGRVGKLPDGKIVVVKPSSSDGRPTL